MVSLNRDTAVPLAGLSGSLAVLLRETDNETRVTVVALLPSLALLLWERGLALVLLAGMTLALAIFWCGLFARLRTRPLALYGVPAAMLFVMLLAPGTPWWQAALSFSFGITFGSLVFGGRGFSFLHPAVAALAFQLYSFPPGVEAAPEPLFLFAVLAGALLMLAAGHLSRRTLAGLAIGITAIAAWSGEVAAAAALLHPTAALVLLFLVCDPGSGSATRAGRWIHGVLVAMLLFVLGSGGDGITALRSLVFATLLASILVALIDRCVIMVHAASRRRRLERV